MLEPYLDLERKLRPLAEPLPAPLPGDWLAEHDEPGQTFAECLDDRPSARATSYARSTSSSSCARAVVCWGTRSNFK
jgi:hypothetical protein